MPSPDRLPPGIYFRSGESPPPFFRLVTFNFTPSATPASAAAALAAIWELLAELRDGQIRDLKAARPEDPVVRVDPGDLAYMLCYGHRLFSAEGRQAPLVSEDLRPDMTPELSALAAGPLPSLKWSGTAQPAAAQTDFAIQLTATSELAVARPIVEIQKLIDDQALSVQLVCFFSGLHRDDRRSWIDFHDGINNMSSDERRAAIEIAQSPLEWLKEGTTLTFLKIAIDMQGWRRLSREQQEAIVGRDKLSGIPITNITVKDGDIKLTKMTGCPINREIGIGDGWPTESRDPGPVAGLAKTSHIHRANLTRQPPATDAARRVYRQGYEFVDSPPGGGVRVGLNFVGFQHDANIVLEILRNTDWLGDANFGGIKGDPAVPAFKLMSLIAGATFAVPPMSPDSFPGSALFTSLP